MKRIQSWNPELGILFFDDEQCHSFIQQHFDKDVLSAYEDIKPGAYKADIFRYCALYVLGGIYSDVYIPYQRAFSSLWDLSLDYNYLIQDAQLGDSIQISTIACPPASDFIAQCLEMAVNNIRRRAYSDSPYGVTGPALAGECLRRYNGQESFVRGCLYESVSESGYPVSIDYQLIWVAGDFADKVSKGVFIDKNAHVLFPYKLNRNRTYRKEETHYFKAWHNKNIYAEKESNN